MAATETWKVEHSWEATTLDYLSPIWYTTEEGFETEAAAEEVAAAKRTEVFAKGEMVAYRVTRVPSDAERQQWVDEDAAWNARYWADRARVAREAEEAVKATYALKGQTVTVTKGRKVPLGTTGEVFWVGEGKFGGFRVGLKTAEGETHWTASSNVEVSEAVPA